MTLHIDFKLDDHGMIVGVLRHNGETLCKMQGEPTQRSEMEQMLRRYGETHYLRGQPGTVVIGSDVT